MKQAREVDARRISLFIAKAFAVIVAEDFSILAGSMSPVDQKEQTVKAEPEEVSLNIVLWATQALFESRSALPEKTFEKVLESGKKVLRQTQNDANVR